MVSNAALLIWVLGLFWLDLSRLGWLFCLVGLLPRDGLRLLLAFFFSFFGPPRFFLFSSLQLRLFTSFTSYFNRMQRIRNDTDISVLQKCVRHLAPIAGVLHLTTVSKQAAPVRWALFSVDNTYVIWRCHVLLSVVDPFFLFLFFFAFVSTCATPAQVIGLLIHFTYLLRICSYFPFLRDNLNPKTELKPFYELWRQIIMTHDMRWIVFFHFFFFLPILSYFSPSPLSSPFFPNSFSPPGFVRI